MSNYDNQIQWNMADSFMKAMHDKLFAYSQAVFQGEILAAYRILRDVYDSILHRIEIDKNKDEIKTKLQSLLDNCEKSLIPQNAQDKKIYYQMLKLSISQAEKTLRNAYVDIMSLLYRYELLYPVKQYTTFEEEIQGDFP